MRHLRNAAVLYAVLTASVAASIQEPKPPSQPAAGQASYPAPVELSLGREELIENEAPIGDDDFRLVSTSSETLWLILTHSERLLYAVRREGVWSPVEPIPIGDWSFINRITAVAGKDGNPVAVWTGFDETPGEAVATVRWTGSAWSPPEILDRLDGSVLYLHSLSDRRGNVHIAYERPLEPRESYNIGFILGEGFFPSKCWHAFSDGQRWSQPRPTTGRGRFDVDALGLSCGPGNSISVAVRVNPAHGPGYVGVQVWDGTQWSKIEKLKEGEGGGMVATPWGDRLVWWDKGQSFGAALVRGERETPVPWSYWGNTVPVTNDPSGRIAVYLRDRIGGIARVWNGERWSNALQCGDATKLIATADGKLLAANWQRDGVRVQEILMRQTVVTRLASRPSDSFTQTRTSRPPDVHEAVRSRDIERVREILSNNPSLALSRDYYGNTPLMLATRNGDTAIVELLLRTGAEPDRSDFMDSHPLHVAAQKGLIDIARLLLAHGAAVNPEDMRGKTPLAYAEAAGYEELAGLLKARGGTPKDYEAHLVRAVRTGNQEQVKQLLDRGLSVETAVPNGHCLLDFAAEAGNIVMAKLLIARGASVKRVDRYGRSALYWASSKGKADMVAFLIGEGADPNAKEWRGMTPLHEAVERSQWHEPESLETIKNLIAGGAHVNAKNKDGITPLKHAERYGTDAIRAYLRSCGATE